MKRYNKIYILQEDDKEKELRFSVRYKKEELDFLKIQLEKMKDDLKDIEMDKLVDAKEKIADMQDSIDTKEEAYKSAVEALNKYMGNVTVIESKGMKRYKQLFEMQNNIKDMYNKIKKLKSKEKSSFDISNIDPEELQKFIFDIEKEGYKTYTSSGKIVVQK